MEFKVIQSARTRSSWMVVQFYFKIKTLEKKIQGNLF